MEGYKMHNVLIFLTIVTGWVKVPSDYGNFTNNKLHYQSSILLGFGEDWYPKGLNFYNQLNINISSKTFLVFNQRGFYQGLLGGYPSVLGVAFGYRISNEFSTFFELERGFENIEQIDYGSNIFAGFNLVIKNRHSLSFIVGHGMLSTKNANRVYPLGIGVNFEYSLTKNFKLSSEYEPVPNSFIITFKYAGWKIHNFRIGPSLGVRLIKKDIVTFLAFNFNTLSKLRPLPPNTQIIDIEFLTCMNGRDTLLIPENFWKNEKKLKTIVIQIINPPQMTIELSNFHALLSSNKFNLSKSNKIWCALRRRNGELKIVLSPIRDIAEKYSGNDHIHLIEPLSRNHNKFILRCFIPIGELYKF